MNHLSKEKSPYLLQHQHNPVNWYAWGEEAFAAARAQNKLIFLSIGYSTCYWCHVMEKESFESDAVAAVLNAHYISIKVDREERADIDRIYMDAVVAMTGRGGWPLSALLTPDLKPFFGATYIRSEQFINLLERVHQLWINQPQTIVDSAAGLTNALLETAKASDVFPVDQSILAKCFEQLSRTFDDEFGGFGGAPKFPPSGAVSLLLRIHRRSNDAQALAMAQVTLERMARGGIYDHLGGGFHRYSTDGQWLVPHFEKMLYDNALLAVTYLEATQVFRDPMFEGVARETLGYVLREMTAPEGGFYSAQDAGDVGKEGEFFVWTEAELTELLTADELELCREMYGVTTAGNFEHGTNVLFLGESHAWGDKESELAESVHKKLLEARAKRKSPSLDDKILTSWNALMISAMVKGYQVLQDPQYLAAAHRAAAFIRAHLWQNGELLRRYRDGDARFDGYLDDYSYLIQALIDLYETDFNPDWLRWAEQLQAVLDQNFWDQEKSGYFYTRASASDIIVRSKEYTDGAIPSGNSIQLLSLQRLYHLTFNAEYRDRYEKLLQALSGYLVQFPSALARAAAAVDFLNDAPKEIAIIGPIQDELVRETLETAYREFHPNRVLAWAESSGEYPPLIGGKTLASGKAAVYICQNSTCGLPITERAKISAQLASSEALKL